MKMNVFEVAARKEMAWKEMVTDNGYEPISTFYGDFTIAELVSGIAGVKDTYKRCVKSWRDNVEYVTELVMVLNHKIWEHYEKNEDLALVYHQMWKELDGWCMDNLKGEDLQYFIRVLD